MCVAVGSFGQAPADALTPISSGKRIGPSCSCSAVKIFLFMARFPDTPFCFESVKKLRGSSHEKLQQPGIQQDR
jgi:hypothetical protein